MKYNLRVSYFHCLRYMNTISNSVKLNKSTSVFTALRKLTEANAHKYLQKNIYFIKISQYRRRSAIVNIEANVENVLIFHQQ